MIRLAIIGAGIMGEDHARIFANEVPGATLQVVCDPNLDRAKAVAQMSGSFDVSQNPLETIARNDVDAVLIASPDPTHAPLSNSCIAAGKPVLCEKPLSHSAADCVDVMRVEEASGQHRIMLGFMRRFDQAYVEIRDTLNSGRLGHGLMMHNFHRNAETPAVGFTSAMAITNSAPHEFDAVRHVLGNEITAVSAHQPKRSDDRVAPVVMVLETSRGQLATIEINNNAAYGYDVRAELVCEAGSMSINNVASTRIDQAFSSATRYDADWRGRFHQAYVRQNRDFLRFAETGTLSEIAATAWDGYCAAIVAETAVKALSTGEKQPIKMMPKPEFYSAD